MSKILGPLVLALCLALGFGRPASAQIPAGAIAFSPSAATSITIDEGLLQFTIAQDGRLGLRRHSAAIRVLMSSFIWCPGHWDHSERADRCLFTGTTCRLETVNCASVVCTNSYRRYYDLSITTLTVTGLNGTKIDGASAAVNGSATPAQSSMLMSAGLKSLGGGCAAGLAYMWQPQLLQLCPDHHAVTLIKDMGLAGLTGLGRYANSDAELHHRGFRGGARARIDGLSVGRACRLGRGAWKASPRLISVFLR